MYSQSEVKSLLINTQGDVIGCKVMVMPSGTVSEKHKKLIRRGELFQYSDSEQKLKQEVGDVYAMIDLLVEWDVLSWDEIEEQRNIKREKLKRWSDLI